MALNHVERELRYSDVSGEILNALLSKRKGHMSHRKALSYSHGGKIRSVS